MVGRIGQSGPVREDAGSARMPALRVLKARRRGGFAAIEGVRPSRPTGQLLDQLRGER